MNPGDPQTSETTEEEPDPERPASAAPTLDYAKPDPAPHDPYAALRYRDFRYFLAGWFLAVIGEQILEVAVGWDLYARTGNKLDLGWVGLIIALPLIVLALPAGHLADRLNRRKIVITTCMLNTICAGALGAISNFSGRRFILPLYGLLLFFGISRAIGAAARHSLMPTLLPTEKFANAMTWNASSFQSAAMIGPALGGFILIFSSRAAYITAAVCAAAFGVTLCFVNAQSKAASREPATLKSLAAGVRFVFGTKIILATITLDLFAVLLGGAVYLLPVFAKDILDIGSVGLGVLRAAPAVGAVCMSLLVAHLPPMKHAGRAMLWAVGAFGAATIVFGFSRNVYLSVVMLFLTGAFDNISVLVRHTLVQVMTPNEMRGRVSAVNNVFIGSSNELGGFESGLTARYLGTITSVVAGGIGTIVCVVLTAIVWPQVRAFGSLQDAKPADERPAD